MDITQLFQYGFAGIVSFGLVGIISYSLNRYRRIILEAQVKLFLLIVLYFILLWVPTDVSNALYDKLVAAITGGIAIHALWTIRKGV